MKRGSQKIFGPVPSRRLGASLGIDVIPYKTCSFDCVYCECGATTDRTVERRDFCPVRGVLDECEARLSAMRVKPDCVTLSGSGEPTLYSRMGELIDEMKRATKLPVAVITNSSLLWMSEVREELSRADIVLPSLDAAVEDSFRRINRPHESLSLAKIIEGLAAFLAEYRGTVLFEILLIEGYNTDQRNLDALRKILSGLRVDKVQLNTAVRPGTEKHIVPLDEAALENIRGFFGTRCEVIASAQTTRMRHEESVLEDTIVSLLERRPCTIDDMSRSLGIAKPVVAKIVNGLAAAGAVIEHAHGGNIFFTAARRNK
jgi:wyosine [tRNA(Phe)-imidazoG37] synthetase (radical SAM superfamily)